MACANGDLAILGSGLEYIWVPRLQVTMEWLFGLCITCNLSEWFLVFDLFMPHWLLKVFFILTTLDLMILHIRFKETRGRDTKLSSNNSGKIVRTLLPLRDDIMDGRGCQLDSFIMIETWYDFWFPSYVGFKTTFFFFVIFRRMLLRRQLYL